MRTRTIGLTIITFAITFLIGCTTTEPAKTMEEVSRERAVKISPKDRTMIIEVCSESGHKALCHRTMAVAVQECAWLAAKRNHHARCILGSIQDQMKGSKVKYLLLGGRQ